jgi:sulfur transfer complex TusBCD TusB component (DsrH family)
VKKLAAEGLKVLLIADAVLAAMIVLAWMVLT